MRVLIVDDSAAYRRSLCELVGSTPGLEVAGVAESGENAVQLADLLRPNLVLMDLRMDGMGGVAAACRIMDAHPRAKVVLLSGAGANDLAAAADLCGGIDAIDKHELCRARLLTLAGGAPTDTADTDTRVIVERTPRLDT